MRQRTAERRDYWSWLGPLCLALFAVFIGVILGQLTLNQMLLWPTPILDPAARELGKVVAAVICLAFPVLLSAAALLARRPRWLPNILAFFLVGFLAYVYSLYFVGTPPR